MVIGAHRFTEFLPVADRIYLTIIDNDFEGETLIFLNSAKRMEGNKKEELKMTNTNSLC